MIRNGSAPLVPADHLLMAGAARRTVRSFRSRNRRQYVFADVIQKLDEQRSFRNLWTITTGEYG